MIDVGLLSLLVLVSLIAILLTGAPVAFSLMVLSMVPFILLRGAQSLTVMVNATYTVMVTDIYLALPTFIFMAAIMEFSGLGSAMYEIMYKWMSGLKGGLAMGTIAISTAMAAMSGTAATATLTMGMLAYPEMERRGYDKRMIIGAIPAGGILGPLIPPSIVMILVAAVGHFSVGRLFIAGIFPGLLASLGFMVYIGIRCWLNPAMGPPIPPEERVGWEEKLKSLRLAGLPFLLIFLVLGLLYLGVCTPSEAGGIGALGAMICAAIYRNLTWSNLSKATSRFLKITSMLFWLIIAGAFFSQMIGILGVQTYVKDLLTGANVNPWVILIGILGSVFIMGMFMDDAPIIIIFLPIFLPVIKELGFDPFWFGFIFCMDCLIGILTPPFGMVLFYFKGLNIPGVSMMDIYRSVIPYILIMIVVMILCIVFPPIAVWLPSTMI